MALLATPMLKRFLRDETGASGAEYALIFGITILCLGGAAAILGGKSSSAMHQAAETITGKIVEVAREVRPN